MIEQEFQEEHGAEFEGLRERAPERGLTLVRTPAGFAFAPVENGEVIPPDQLQQMPEDRRAELYALLSAISQVPIDQSLAARGSVNQRGEVQAIGGVNEKIEGFFEICRERGLTGEQGVLIPADHVDNLVLREEVREAVAVDRFHVYPVETIDAGVELLTDTTMGDLREGGTYPEETINRKITDRICEYAERRTEFLTVDSDGTA